MTASPASWFLAAAAVAAAGGLTVASAVASPSLPGLVGYFGGFATVVLAISLLAGQRMLIGVSVAGLGVAAAMSLVGSGELVRVEAVAAGVALLAVLELAHRSCEARRPIRAGLEVLGAEVAGLAALAFGAAALGLALLALAAGRPPGGVATQAAGAVAVLGLVVLVAWTAAGRTTGRTTRPPMGASTTGR